MALLQETSSMMGNKPSTDKATESIHTANQQLIKPGKVGGRAVEVIPKRAEFNENEAKKMVDFARSQAVTGSVGGDSLVQTQLDKVLATNGPLMKRARENAAMTTAERGLNNSSIGVQAGEEAAISSALPIAQQDASTYANMDMANLNAKNQFGSLGLSQEYNSYNQLNDQNFSSSENEKNRAGQLQLQSNDQRFQSSERTDSQNYQSGETALDRALRLKQDADAREFQTGERNDSQNYQSKETALDRQLRLDQDQQQRDFTAEQSQLSDARQLDSSRQLSQQSFEQSRTMQELDAKSNLALEDIRFEHQQLINSNATAQAIYANHAQSVASIMSQPGMTPSQAGAALQILNQTTKDNLTLAGALNNVDLSAYAPSGSVSGTSVTDKKGNVTNTFSANGTVIGGQTPAAAAAEAAELEKKKKLVSSYSLNDPKEQLKFDNMFKNPLALKDKDSAKNLEPINLTKKIFKMF